MWDTYEVGGVSATQSWGLRRGSDNLSRHQTNKVKETEPTGEVQGVRDAVEVLGGVPVRRDVLWGAVGGRVFSTVGRARDGGSTGRGRVRVKEEVPGESSGGRT